jgi:hypothetical protein
MEMLLAHPQRITGEPWRRWMAGIGGGSQNPRSRRRARARAKTHGGAARAAGAENRRRARGAHVRGDVAEGGGDGGARVSTAAVRCD